ncbi:hypothetical protein [Luteolibacter sp. Populi]|uniref:hypothetical protein n=1 Tax=Luteolibacter sp. Populi TaxID=3230487 RepID=UPI003467CDD5
MKASSQKALAFGIATGVSAWAWSHFWPQAAAEPSASSPASAPIVRIAAWSDGEIRSALHACAAAANNTKRMQAAMQLGKIPVGSILAALEAEPPVKDRELTLAAKVLLIRWAGSDGNAASAWAWKNFRSGSGYGLWDEALREIGPAWAWHDAAGLHRWVMACQHVGMEEVSRDTAKASEKPILDFSQVSEICRWLAPEEPRLAFELLQTRNGYSSEDRLIGMDFNLTQVKEALEAFPDLDQSKPGVFRDSEIHAQRLLSRWQELDPEDFARSPYAHLHLANPYAASTRALVEWKTQAPAERAAAATRLIDALRNRDGIKTVDAWGELPVGAATMIQAGIGMIASSWATEDPVAASEWIESLPEAERASGYRVVAAAAAPRDLDLALLQAEKLPSASRMGAFVEAFDSWSKANPGKAPDATGWSEQRHAAWEDLKFLSE